MIIQEFHQFYYINNGQEAYTHFRFGWGGGQSACIYCNIGPNTYLMKFCKIKSLEISLNSRKFQNSHSQTILVSLTPQSQLSLQGTFDV